MLLHEAGHAYMGHLLGMRVMRMTVDPPEVRFDPRSTITNCHRTGGAILLKLAGYAAIVAYGGDARLAVKGCDTDFEHARLWVAQMPRAKGLETFEDWKRLAVQTFEGRKQVIGELAAALGNAGTLDGDEVRAIMRQAQRRPRKLP